MPEDVKANIIAESKRIEEDALHSGKAHLDAAARWSALHLWLGIPASACAALSAVSVVKACPLLTAALAVVAAVLTALMTFLKPDQYASRHLSSGNRYLGIRSRARMFREIDALTGSDPSALATALGQLNDQRTELNEASPQIPRWAYERAKKGIDAGEAVHAVDQKARRRR